MLSLPYGPTPTSVQDYWKNHSFDNMEAFPGGSEVKASAHNVGDLDSNPGLGRSLGEGNGNPFQYSCLENPRDGRAWWVAQSRTRLKRLSSSSSSILSKIREKQILYIITYIWNLKNKTNKCSHLIFVILFNSLNPILLTPSHVLLMSVFLIFTFTLLKIVTTGYWCFIE